MDNPSGLVMPDGFADSFVQNSLDENEGLEVMDGILDESECTDVPAQQFSRENPFYEEVGDGNMVTMKVNPPNQKIFSGSSFENPFTEESGTTLDAPTSGTSAAFEEAVNIDKESSESLTDSEAAKDTVSAPSTTNVFNCHNSGVSCVEKPNVTRNLRNVPEKIAIPEPENMIQWRKDRAELLVRRDELEAERKKEMCELGKSQLEIWEKNYNEVLETSKMKNRESNDMFLNVNPFEKERIGFIESVDSIFSPREEETLTAWEYIVKLCDLRPNNRKIKSDVSRMRMLMLQLKAEKFSNPKSMVPTK